MPVYVKPTTYLKKVDGYIEVKRKGYMREPARVIRCRVCKKIILKKRKGKTYTKDEILARIRRHYKKEHPQLFKEMIIKAVKTRAERRKAKSENPGNPRKKVEIPVLKILEF